MELGAGVLQNVATRRFPIQTKGRSELNSECGIGAGFGLRPNAKHIITKYLFTRQATPALAAAVH